MGLFRIAIIVVSLAVGWKVVSKLRTTSQEPRVDGYFHPDFKSVADTFRKNVESGKEKGGTFAVYKNGELILDMWGGSADDEAGRPWRKDTMTIAWSATKFVGAIIIAKMVDKGWLEYERPVSHYWPEFAQNNKQDITVEMLISHQAGLFSFSGKSISVLDIKDNRQEMEDLLAAQRPKWKPGSAFGYHAFTFGLYIDTLARKADPRHRNISQIFEEEIAKPFDIDFHIGVPLEANHRMARLQYITLPEALWESALSPVEFIIGLYRNLPLSKSTLYRGMAVFNDFFPFIDPVKQSVGLTSATGAGSARALAKLSGILASGGSYKGRQLLSGKMIQRLQTLVNQGFDQVMHLYISSGPGTVFLNNSKGDMLYGHPGFGGQVAFADPKNEIGFAYLTNNLGIYHVWNDPRLLDIQNAVYNSLYASK